MVWILLSLVGIVLGAVMFAAGVASGGSTLGNLSYIIGVALVVLSLGLQARGTGAYTEH